MLASSPAVFFFFFSSRRRHTRLQGDWSSDVCSSDLLAEFSTRATILENALEWRRWAELLVLTARRVVYFQDFGLWVLAGVLLLWSLRKRQVSVLGTALFLACAAYGPIYALQPHRLDWIFRTSADRILMQLWPVAVLATMPALARTTART